MLEFWIVLIIFLALAFDFINGFHDAANSIATIVSTRVLKPQYAVLWAAFFNFVAFLFFETKVAQTIGKGIIDPSIVGPLVVFSALMGAIIWNLITWYYGIPSSSSHALVGGLVGAGLSHSGAKALQMQGLTKIVYSIVLSPLSGMILASLLMILAFRLFFRVSGRKVDLWARRGQFVSAALYSLGHGGNDAQKTMGIISVLLFSTGHLGNHFYVPHWVVFTCQLAMGLGTLFGGWRIVKTMGMRITELKPIGGCCAEVAGAATLFGATALGIPVSTTHTITGSIVGVGVVNRFRSVRWGVASRVVWAWVLTIPAAALMSSISYYAAKWMFP